MVTTHQVFVQEIIKLYRRGNTDKPVFVLRDNSVIKATRNISEDFIDVGKTSNSSLAQYTDRGGKSYSVSSVL